MSRRLVLSACSTVLVAAWLVQSDASASARPTCAGQPATIVSRQAGALVTGTSGPDVIVALAASQTVRAGGGADVVCLRGRNGRAEGGAGHDVLVGSRFADVLTGGAGDDLLLGRRGSDDLGGGKGDDRLVGGSTGGGDSFVADPGNDTWVDRWHGGHVDQGSFPSSTFDFSGAVAIGLTVDLSGHVSAGTGRGTAHSAETGHDVLRFPVGRNSAFVPAVVGTSFDDTFVGSIGRDRFDSADGADRLSGLGGADDLTMEGDPAHPTTGDRRAVLLGGAGADTLRLVDSSVRTRMSGGAGRDHLVAFTDGFFTAFVPTNAHLNGDSGNDRISAELSLDSGAALSGGPGVDRASVTLREPADATPYGTVTADLGTGTISTTDDLSVPTAAFEHLTLFDHVSPVSLTTAFDLLGTSGADSLVFFGPPTVPASLHGLGGDDALQGGQGDDLLAGGPGHDTGDGRGGLNTCRSVEVATHCG